MSKEEGAQTEAPVGQVTHYFSHAEAAALELSDKLSVGDRVHIRGHTTDFIVDITSMQIDNQPVTSAGPGASVGIKVPGKVRPGDMVYRAG